MHPNESRPHPLPPLRASAWGSRPPAFDKSRYHETLIDALGWADGQEGVEAAYVEETIDRYPYCVNGQTWLRVSPGVWRRAPAREAEAELAPLSATGQQMRKSDDL